MCVCGGVATSNKSLPGASNQNSLVEEQKSKRALEAHAPETKHLQEGQACVRRPHQDDPGVDCDLWFHGQLAADEVESKRSLKDQNPPPRKKHATMSDRACTGAAEQWAGFAVRVTKDLKLEVGVHQGSALSLFIFPKVMRKVKDKVRQ